MHARLKIQLAAAMFVAAGVITVMTATSADADAESVNPVAMGESMRAQLLGKTGYRFAIAVDGEVETTGSAGAISSLPAVAALRNGAPGGDGTSCHIELGSHVEAVLLVDAPTDTQPCGIVGIAYDAAR